MEIQEHRTLQRDATSPAKVDRKRYWIRIAEKMKVVWATGDFGRLFHHAPNGRYEAELLSCGTTNQLILEQQQKIDRWTKYLDQSLNPFVNRSSKPSSPVRSESQDVSFEAPSLIKIAEAVI